MVWFLSFFFLCHGKAVNKLAEIMNRKGPVKRGADTDVRRKEKENRKLHMELKSEREKLTQMMIKYQKEINEMQAVRSFCSLNTDSVFCISHWIDTGFKVAYTVYSWISHDRKCIYRETGCKVCIIFYLFSLNNWVLW